MNSSGNGSDSQDSKSERTPPRDRFAFDVVQFDLRSTAAILEAEIDQGQSGHRQVALYKREKATIALFRFEQGGRMPSHRAKGTVVIQVIEGKLSLDVAGAKHVLETGGVLVLAPGVPHDVEAVDRTLMLLTVCLID